MSQVCFRMNTSVGIRVVWRVQSRPRGLRGTGSTASLESTRARPALQARCCPLLLEDLPPDTAHGTEGREGRGRKRTKVKKLCCCCERHGRTQKKRLKTSKRLLLADLEAGRNAAEDFHFLKGFSSTVHKCGFNKDQGLAAAQIHVRFLFPRDQD